MKAPAKGTRITYSEGAVARIPIMGASPKHTVTDSAANLGRASRLHVLAPGRVDWETLHCVALPPDRGRSGTS
jgi:hypothetical protein